MSFANQALGIEFLLKNKGKLEIVEEEAELIRLIFNEYSKGEMGTQRLGHYLYKEHNIKSKTNTYNNPPLYTLTLKSLSPKCLTYPSPL